jgi:hypothetical protein
MNEPTARDASLGPARPDRLTVDYYEEPDTLVVHKRRGGGPSVILMLWLSAWTVGCVVLVVQVLKEPSLGMIAFALPFWASWLFVASLLVWMIFGKETLFLDRQEAIFRRKAFVRLSSRIVPREELRGFRECRSSYTENDQYLWGIEMVTLGKPVRFAFRLPDRERAWLIYQLNRFLGVSGPVQQRHPRPPMKLARDASPGESATSNSTHEATEVLSLESTLTEPPTGCRWRLTDETDAFDFRQKGRLNIGAVAMLLFVSVFWNGIVSVFVLLLFGLMPINNPPQGWQWWGLFVFLIPFEVIGLALFAALLVAVLEPFRRTACRFEWDRIISQTRWPVYRHTRAWEVVGLDRVELRRCSDDPKRRRFSDATADMSGHTPFDLALVAGNNIDLCEIRHLTEGEARWMAGIILDRRRNWFGR